jgi:hypothetical protein
VYSLIGRIRLPLQLEFNVNERIQELAYDAEDYADIIVDQGGEFHVTYVSIGWVMKSFITILIKNGTKPSAI